MHIAVSIDYILGLNDKDLEYALVKGAEIGAGRLREELNRLKDSGLEFVPTCDDHDEKGKCNGHPTTKDA